MRNEIFHAALTLSEFPEGYVAHTNKSWCEPITFTAPATPRLTAFFQVFTQSFYFAFAASEGGAGR